jgi:hypothetical protein
LLLTCCSCMHQLLVAMWCCMLRLPYSLLLVVLLL